MQRPYCLLMSPGRRLHCLSLPAVMLHRPVQVTISAQYVGEDPGISWISLYSCLPQTFAIAGDRSWVDRVYLEPGRSQRYHEQVLIGLHRNECASRATTALGDHGQQLRQPGRPVSIRPWCRVRPASSWIATS